MADDVVFIGSAVTDAIRSHAAETYPNECCGALYGLDTAVQLALALPNTTDEGPRRRFMVSTTDYRRAEARAAETGLSLLGFYHSHPDAPARPSQYDLDHAWPSFLYLILGIEGGEPKVLTAWSLNPGRTAFDERVLRALTS